MSARKVPIRFAHERVKKAREALGMTVSRLAAFLNVDEETILSFEDGTEEPLGSQLARMSHVLHKPMSYFIQIGG